MIQKENESAEEFLTRAGLLIKKDKMRTYIVVFTDWLGGECCRLIKLPKSPHQYKNFLEHATWVFKEGYEAYKILAIK